VNLAAVTFFLLRFSRPGVGFAVTAVWLALSAAVVELRRVRETCAPRSLQLLPVSREEIHER
jgi:hypothetical protein